MVPTEVVTATSTEYSVLGAKSCLTLVVEVLTVVCIAGIQSTPHNDMK